MNIIARRFDKAAPHYDQAADIQARIAQELIAWVMPLAPRNILDIGCGTGFAAEAAARRWPQASITAMDAAPAMLRAAQAKLPDLKIIEGDALRADIRPVFDTVFSSMMLHWLPQPREALRRWQGWLKPDGHLYVALPMEGSFREWRDLCREEGLQDGLWRLPKADFADGIARRMEHKTLSVTYSSAHAFLRYLKMIGAATPHPAHEPVTASRMRGLLGKAVKPFRVSYQILYLEAAAVPGNL
ncbi:MAG: methyltransferase domain-containing protein [Alphaproteobacteria bacterium]|nr:methyltransferase domain-containing protein [Alphaproteobacteria bacterium]